MRKVIIGKFGPSARQILDAALHIAGGARSEIVVKSKPEGGTVFGDAAWEGRRKKDYERGLSYLHDLSERASLKPQVFLGGSADPTTWRTDIAIPILQKEGVDFVNPQVPNWEEQDAYWKALGVEGGIMEVEAKAKLESLALLFVFAPLTRCIATINEAVEFMMAGKQVVVIVAAYINPGQEIAGQTVTAEEAMDLNLARAELFGVAKAKGVHVFDTVAQATLYCTSLVHTAKRDHYVADVR